MTAWRKKMMRVSEWAHFQQLFGELQLLYYRGNPDLALFRKSTPEPDLDEIYITGPNLELIERLSPDGWESTETPSGEGMSLLVGTPESWTHLGVSRHSPEGK